MTSLSLGHLFLGALILPHLAKACHVFVHLSRFRHHRLQCLV
jgi:hypothetical protein